MRNMIKKIVLTVTAAAAIAGVAAGGESAEPGGPSNTGGRRTGEQIEQIDPNVREGAYIATLSKMGVPYSSEAEAVEIGKDICQVLDLGVTVDELFLEAAQLPGMT